MNNEVLENNNLVPETPDTPVTPEAASTPVDTEVTPEVAPTPVDTGIQSPVSFDTPVEAPVEAPACYLYGNNFVWGKYKNVTGYIIIENICSYEQFKYMGGKIDYV